MCPTISKEQASPGAAAMDQRNIVDTSKILSKFLSFLEGRKKQFLSPTLLFSKLIKKKKYSEEPSHLSCVI